MLSNPVFFTGLLAFFVLAIDLLFGVDTLQNKIAVKLMAPLFEGIRFMFGLLYHLAGVLEHDRLVREVLRELDEVLVKHQKVHAQVALLGHLDSLLNQGLEPPVLHSRLIAVVLRGVLRRQRLPTGVPVAGFFSHYF